MILIIVIVASGRRGRRLAARGARARQPPELLRGGRAVARRVSARRRGNGRRYARAKAAARNCRGGRGRRAGGQVSVVAWLWGPRRTRTTVRDHHAGPMRDARLDAVARDALTA